MKCMEFHMVYGIYLLCILDTQNTWQAAEHTTYTRGILRRNAWNSRYTMASLTNIVHLQGWIPITICFCHVGVVY